MIRGREEGGRNGVGGRESDELEGSRLEMKTEVREGFVEDRGHQGEKMKSDVQEVNFEVLLVVVSSKRTWPIER